MALLLVPLWSVATARADVTVQVQHTEGVGTKSPIVSTSALFIASDRLAQRWDGTDEDVPDTIFRGDRDLMWVIDHEDKTYAEMDQAMVENVGSQVGQALTKVQEELAKLPADQRAWIEQSMKGITGDVSAALPKITLEKTSETKTIGGFPCTKYERREDGALTELVWVAPHEATGIEPSDTAVFKEMVSMVESLLGTLGPNAMQLVESELSVVTKLDGWPILVQDLSGGKVVDETQVQSIRHEDVPDSTFEIPAGYTKKAISLPSE